MTMGNAVVYPESLSYTTICHQPSTRAGTEGVKAAKGMTLHSRKVDLHLTAMIVTNEITARNIQLSGCSTGGT
jgi:hypothetical protein